MRQIPLHFSFKGKRNYLHGTDIYTTIIKQIESEYNRKISGFINLAIHTMIYKECDLVIKQPGDFFSKPDLAVVNFMIDLGDDKVGGWLVATNRPIQSRYDYDEERIEVLCKVRNQEIIITGETVFLSIEVVVSMTKQLHNALFPSSDAKWFFTKLELIRPLQYTDSSNLIIRHKHNFNNRLTKSEIFSQKRSIGNIYFSLVKL